MGPLVRRVLALLAIGALASVAMVALFGDGDARTRLVPGTSVVDPLAYAPDREAAFAAAAARGHAHVLYAKSPGGARASAARTARYRPLVERRRGERGDRGRHARGDDPARERRPPGRRRRP